MKVGDRVYFKVLYGPEFSEGFGVIDDLGGKSVYIIPDSEIQVPNGSINRIVKNRDNEICIPEKVYNSKLYKALK